jgi:competence protein ComEC
LLCFLAGTCLAPADLVSAPLAGAVMAWLAALLFLRWPRAAPFSVSMALCFLMAGWSAITVASRPEVTLLADAPPGEARVLLGRPVLADAVVVEATRLDGEFLLTELRLLGVQRRAVRRPARDRVRLRSETSGPYLTEGDRLRAWLVLRKVTGFANGRPRSRVRRPLSGRLKSPLLVDRIEPGRLSARRALGGLRRHLLARLKLGLALGGASSRVRSLAAAVVLGDRSGLDEADRRHLVDGGAAHVLAISGLHMTVLVGLLALGLRRAGFGALTVSVGLMVTIPIYLLLLPVRPSIARAALMGLAFPIGRLVGRETMAMNILGGSGLVLLALSPALGTDPGFLLSFTVTAALIHLTPAGGDTSWARRVRTVLQVSLVANAASNPLTAYFFGRATPAAVLANLLAVPAASLLVAASAGAMILAAIDPLLAVPCALPARLSVRLLFWASAWPGAVPGGHLLVPTGRPLLVVSALAALFACHRPGRRLWAIVVAAGLQVAILAGVAPPRPLPYGVLALRALDVGQGDALLVGLPDGGALLVDGGGLRGSRLDVGRAVVLPAVRDAGVRRLRAVALSHSHHDHGGGLAAVLEEMRVEELWLGSVPPGDSLVAGLVDRAVAAGTAVRVLRRGDRLKRGGARVICLHPPPAESRSSPNRQSLVLRLEARGRSLLLPGDLEGAGERVLQNEGWLVRSTALKVAHHGSATSTQPGFLDRVRPQVALISVGRVNPWDHPHLPVLRRLEERGIAVYRTDRHGAVTVALEPDGPVIEAERGSVLDTAAMGFLASENR